MRVLRERIRGRVQCGQGVVGELEKVGRPQLGGRGVVSFVVGRAGMGDGGGEGKGGEDNTILRRGAFSSGNRRGGRVLGW